MQGEKKKKFRSVPKRAKTMLCTSSYQAKTSALTLELIQLSHTPPASAHTLPNSTSWWKKFPPKRLPTNTPRLLCQQAFVEAKCYHSGHYLALPLLQTSYQQHGHPAQSLLPLRGGMERLAVKEKENKVQEVHDTPLVTTSFPPRPANTEPCSHHLNF